MDLSEWDDRQYDACIFLERRCCPQRLIVGPSYSSCSKQYIERNKKNCECTAVHGQKNKRESNSCSMKFFLFILLRNCYTVQVKLNGDFCEVETSNFFDSVYVRFLDRSHLVQAHSTHPRPRKLTTSLVCLWSSLL